MPTDKNEPADSQTDKEAVRPGENGPEAGSRSRLSESMTDIHYEPEAHHQWFPSEKFFINWLSTCICGFVSLCLALLTHHLVSPGYRIGDRAEHDIRATHAIVVEDEQATRNARAVARSKVVPIFMQMQTGKSPDQLVGAQLDQIEELQRLSVVRTTDLSIPEHLVLLKITGDEFARMSVGDAQLSPELGKIKSKLNKAGRLKQVLARIAGERTSLQKYLETHPNVSDEQEVIAIGLAPADLPGFRETLKSASSRLFHVVSQLPVEDAVLLNDTAIEFVPDAWPESLRKAAASILASQMPLVVTVDASATEAKADKAAEQVRPITRQIKFNDLIVRRAATIAPENLLVLQAMGITDDTSRVAVIGGLLISIAAAVALVALFLYTFEAKLLFSTRSISLMYTLATATLAAAVIGGKAYPQFIPLPATALLLAIFFGQRAALAVTLPLAMFIAVDRLCDFNSLVALGTAAGAAIASYSKRRYELTSIGLVVGTAQGFGFLAALAFSQTQMTPTSLGSQAGMEFVGGIASSIVAVGVMPFLENIFGLVTPFRLAELTDADQPLLRRLEENAPGTYQHSLAVANLAEAGARAIGGDVILVRAGSYYHDVGKMVRPKYFIENQLGATNPHDSMTPEESRERVLAHVTDGIELAKKHALPKAVQDFIPMHQGTSLMAYFYHKACMRDGVERVEAKDYRYPGPKPQSKETSIVMLADISEAVTHSMKDPSEDEVDAAIEKVFENRWNDGQFDESGLTYNELQRIRKAFVRVWRTLHHDRLKYPSTTTGRMPVPPNNLPSAASLGVMANEFAPDAPPATANGGKQNSSQDKNGASDNAAQEKPEDDSLVEEAIRDEGCS